MTTATDTNTERIARLEGAYEHLATKADLAQLELRLTQEMTQQELRLTQEMAQVESRLTQEMTQVESRMAQEIARVETRMTWRMIGAAGVIIAAVGLIVRFL